MSKKTLVYDAKRKLIWMIVFTIVATMFASTAIMAETVKKDYEVGDVNRDGSVNAIDMAFFRGYLLGLNEYSEINGRKWEADVDGNDKIDAIDFAYLRKFVLGMIDKLPKQAEIVNPTATVTIEPVTPEPKITPDPKFTPKPNITPTATVPMPKATMVAPYLPQPSTDPNKILTHMDRIRANLAVKYPNTSVSFYVTLHDNQNNPVAGKEISMNWGKSPNNIMADSAVTDASGKATFTLNKDYNPNTFYREWYDYINFYFDGDDTYNPSVMQDIVTVSNNGGSPALIPLPSPALDVNKTNTSIMPVENEPVNLTSYSVSSEKKSFKIKLIDKNGEPVVGKVVGWQNNFPNIMNPEYLAVTNSQGIAEFSFTMVNLEDAPYVEYDSYINLYFDGDDTYNPSVYYAKVRVSRKG